MSNSEHPKVINKQKWSSSFFYNIQFVGKIDKYTNHYKRKYRFFDKFVFLKGIQIYLVILRLFLDLLF